jgi:hypothetical protein
MDAGMTPEPAKTLIRWQTGGRRHPRGCLQPARYRLSGVDVRCFARGRCVRMNKLLSRSGYDAHPDSSRSAFHLLIAVLVLSAPALGQGTIRTSAVLNPRSAD